MDQATEALARWRHNIFFVPQLIQNDVSSTKVRLFLRRGLSVRYLLPLPVVDYIEQNHLYMDEATSQSAGGGGHEKREDKGYTHKSPNGPASASTSSS